MHATPLSVAFSDNGRPLGSRTRIALVAQFSAGGATQVSFSARIIMRPGAVGATHSRYRGLLRACA
jgi:hypothetical protein